MNVYVIVHDKASEILSKHFKNCKKIYLSLPNNVSVKPKLIYNVSKILSKYDFENSIILYGNNRRHYITLSILLSIKQKKTFPSCYLHIDQHPDDFELVENISSGNFTKYIKELLSVKTYYIGFMRPESKNTFDDYFIIRKSLFDLNKIKYFLNNLNNIYVSVDLDILKYEYCPTMFNKNISYLLDLKDLIKILNELKDKVFAVDVCGFLYKRNFDYSKVLRTYREIVKVFE